MTDWSCKEAEEGIQPGLLFSKSIPYLCSLLTSVMVCVLCGGGGLVIGRCRLVEKQWGSPELWDDLEMNAGRTYGDIYEELRGLGRGSSSSVVLVRRRLDNQLLAVKKVPVGAFYCVE